MKMYMYILGLLIIAVAGCTAAAPAAEPVVVEDTPEVEDVVEVVPPAPELPADENIEVIAEAPVQENEEVEETVVDSAPVPSSETEEIVVESSKTFVITGKNFRFEMDGQETPELRVAEGDKVRIEFTSTQGFHDWVVDEFGAATSRVSDGGSTFVEFVADKKGTFEYYCSVGSHRQAGMKGMLVVE